MASIDSNLYAILGSSPSSTTEQLMAEYRARAVTCHPDKVGGSRTIDDGISMEKAIEEAEKSFRELVLAKEVLTSGSMRPHYDLYLSMGGEGGTGMSLCEWMEQRERLQQVSDISLARYIRG
jgi:DnaJ-class molecular chaperone